MTTFRKSLTILLTCVLTFASFGSSLAANGHSIKKLKISTNPSNLKTGDTITSLSLSFILNSNTGAQAGRIRVRFRDNLISNEDDFKITRNPDDPTESTVEFSTERDLVTDAEEDANKIRVEYLLSANSEEVLARKTKAIKFRAGGGGNNNDPDDPNNPGNGGDEEEDEEKILLISLKVEVTEDGEEVVEENGEADNGSEDDDSSSEDLIVSANERTFTITARGDKAFHPEEDEESYNQATSAIVKNLIIKKKDITGEVTEIQDTLDIDLAEETRTASNDASLNETVYEFKQTTKDAQTLTFKIDLKKFFDDLSVETPNNSKVKDKVKIKIDPIEAKFDSLVLENNNQEIFFDPKTTTPIVKSNNPLRMLSKETVNIVGEFTTNETVGNTVRAIATQKETKKKGKTVVEKSTIQAVNNAKSKVPFNMLTVEDNISVESTGNKVTVNIPAQFEIAAKSRAVFLRKNELLNPNEAKNIVLPNLDVIMKTVPDDLDLRVAGTDLQLTGNTIKILDEPRFSTGKKSAKLVGNTLSIKFPYSNTAGQTEDNFDLGVILKDANGNEISDLETIQAISKVKSSAAKGKKKSAKHKKTFKGKLENLNDDFVNNFAQAAKVELRLLRSQAYLDLMGLDSDPISEGGDSTQGGDPDVDANRTLEIEVK